MGLRTVPVRCVRRIAAREKEETVRSSPMRSKPQEVQPARNVTVATVVAAAAGCLIKDTAAYLSGIVSRTPECCGVGSRALRRVWGGEEGLWRG